jgi:tetratricopeptide (TPR) repeat protein
MFNYKSVIFYLFILAFAGCAYYNILFNAEARYESGLKKIEESKEKEITSDISNDFKAAIDKCWKLLNIYGDSSKYADDALLLIGKSHYHIKEYTMSERFLAQFVDRYRTSELMAEAYLWLGMSLFQLEKYDDALENLNKVLAKNESDDLDARAYLYIGRIYIKQENYEQSRKEFSEVFDLTGNDQYQGEAQFLTAESFYLTNKYKESIQNYQKVLDYDASVDLLFQAVLRIVDCYVYLDQYDQAIATLELISTESKFLHKKSVVLALIGNCYKDQGQFIEATEIYEDVLYTYPRTDGSAIAAYGLGQLMEFAYSDLDSAKNLYQRVGKEYRDSEYKADADDRVKIITMYQKIVNDIEQDLDDLHNFATDTEEQDSVYEEISDEETTENIQNEPHKEKKVKRSEEDIRLSLQRHKFSKAEFFLLTLANYDSAVAAYSNYISISDDSLLVPKAQYALYYIYQYELNDQAKSDSLKRIILSVYPNSPYAAFLTNQEGTIQKQENQESPYKFLYLQGEAMMFDKRYQEAISYFNQIAEEDSGSELAQKARYATAWIYENKMGDIENAVTAYSVLANEYPNSDAGKIAGNKIKVPVNVERDSLGGIQDSTSNSQIDSTVDEADGEKNIPSLDDQLDISVQDADSMDNENPNTPDNPENP